MRITTVLAVTSSMAFAVGCASPGERADRAMEKNIRAELDNYGQLAAAEPHLGINARDGNVTITGPVRTEQNREMIDSLVRNTTGVVAVNDQMQVLYPPTGAVMGQTPAPVYTTVPPDVTAPPPVIVTGPVPGTPPNLRVVAADAADQPLAELIKAELRSDANASEWYQNVIITSQDGKVFLQGSVDSHNERDTLVGTLQRTPGITAIYDQLQVR